MSRLTKALDSSRRIDPGLLSLVGALWLWKATETAGRASGVLRRNLGWGYFVDLTFPIVVTGAVGLFFLFRRVAAPKK